MKSTQIIKKLNNTELGKSGTHDTYILVPQILDISDLFPQIDYVYDFTDIENGNLIQIRHTQGREKRIVGLGEYYREKNLCAGDEIVFEKRVIGEEEQRLLSYKKHMNTFVIQKSSRDFEMLTPERRNIVDKEILVDGKKLQIEYTESRKKRQDSPIETAFYDIVVGGKSIAGDYSSKEIAEIEVNDNSARINRFCAWTKMVIEMEDAK